MSILQAENIQTVVKAANVNVEPYWPGLFAKLFEKKSIADLITNVGAGALFSCSVSCKLATDTLCMIRWRLRQAQSADCRVC